jgi:hypothetical protein
VTSYTRNRGYPYPSSEREAGNGGLHSELLARKVAQDLDAVDAAWAAELQKPTAQLTLAVDRVDYFPANQDAGAPFDTLEHASTGVGLTASTGSGNFFMAKGAAGWYHFSASLHTAAAGVVTAGARHRMSIVRLGNLYGTFQTKEARYCETYQTASSDVFNSLECVMRVEPGDTIQVNYLHANGSGMTAKGTGCRFSGTLIWTG